MNDKLLNMGLDEVVRWEFVMLINASKFAPFVLTTAISLGFSVPVAAAPQIGVTAG